MDQTNENPEKIEDKVEESRIEVETKPEKPKNQNLDLSPKKASFSENKVWRNCKYCGNKQLSKKSATSCSKCRKYIGKYASEKSKSEIEVESVLGDLPSLGDTIIETKKEEPTIADIPEGTYANVISIPFETLAKNGKDHWRLTEREKQTLMPLLKKVGDKWVSKWFDKYPEEAVLAISFGMIVMGKVALEVEYKQSLKKEQEAKNV